MRYTKEKSVMRVLRFTVLTVLLVIAIIGCKKKNSADTVVIDNNSIEKSITVDNITTDNSTIDNSTTDNSTLKTEILSDYDLNLLLHESAVNNDLAGVKDSIDQGANINDMSSDENGYTALVYATLNENLEMIKYLLGAGADIESNADYAGTPLMIAINYGYLEIIKYLVEKGANLEAMSNEEINVLDKAIYKGNLKIINYLIAQGMDTSKMITADWAAVGNLEKVKADIENGANINLSNSKGFTPLEASALNNHIDVIKYLIEKGAEITADTLRYSAGEGNLEVVKYLIDNGADVNSKNSYGSTALMSASMSTSLDVVKYLIDNGADVNTVNNSKETALFDATKKGDIEVVKYLLSKGININAKNINGDTVIDVAFDYGKHNDETIDILKYYIVNSADKSGIDINIWARLGDLEKVKSMLSSTKVDINANNGQLLMNAVLSGNLELVKFLVKKGANIHEETFEEGNALIVASRVGHLDIVKYLVEQGINVNSFIEYHGKTAIEIAENKEHIEIVEYLKSKQKEE